MIFCFFGIVLGTIGGSFMMNERKITYTKITAEELIGTMKENPLKAEQQYNDQYVQLTATVSLVKNEGAQIMVRGEEWNFAEVMISCNIENEEVMAKALTLQTKDTITIFGKITEVHDFFGYAIDTTKIEY